MKIPRLPEAAAAYLASMPKGRTELFPLAPLDVTGVACWNAVFLNDAGESWHGVAPHGVGYGIDDAAALIGTTGELAEAVHSAAGIHRMERRTATYTALKAQLGANHVADPLTLCLPAGSPTDHETTLEWVPAHRWPGAETVWIPIDIAACSVGDLSPGYTPFTTPITNGLGAGPTLGFAIGHGICELLQRDGNGTGFRAMDRGITLDLGDGPKDPATSALLDRLRTLGIDVIPKFASTEFGTANLYCVGAERPGVTAAFPIMVTACGEAASLDREHALRKSILEFAAARVRKAFSHAPLDAVAHVAPPGYLERFQALHSLAGEESRSLREMVRWLGLGQPGLKSLLSETVLARRSSVPFDSLPTYDGPLSGVPLVEELARRFAAHGMEILYLDWSPPGHQGVHVVKAVVPGLEVETMSYHRIGARGVRKLLERGSPLAGLGDPPPGAAPVRLPPDQAATFEAPPWLDTEGIDRIVGSLYPLYREPEIHSAPISMAIASERASVAPLPRGEGWNEGAQRIQSRWCQHLARSRATRQNIHPDPCGISRGCVRLPCLHLHGPHPRTMKFAYNTNGAANHRLDDAIHLIADTGYDGVALTLDIHHLDPFADNFPPNAAASPASSAASTSVASSKPAPASCSTPAPSTSPPSSPPPPKAAPAASSSCAAPSKSPPKPVPTACPSGPASPTRHHPTQATNWLRQGIDQVVARAHQLGATAALEPEPGMLIETPADWAQLAIPGLKLALDTGHCLVTGDEDPANALRRHAPHLATVSIEDMKRGVHIHLPFGEGDMDLPAILKSLDDIGFDRLVCVELSRESHRADTMIPSSLAHLRNIL